MLNILDRTYIGVNTLSGSYKVPIHKHLSRGCLSQSLSLKFIHFLVKSTVS